MKKVDMVYSSRSLLLGFCNSLSISGCLLQQRQRVKQDLAVWRCVDGQVCFLDDKPLQKPAISQVTTNRLLGHTVCVEFVGLLLMLSSGYSHVSQNSISSPPAFQFAKVDIYCMENGGL